MHLSYSRKNKVDTRVIPREKKEKLIPDILIKYQSWLKFSCQLVAIDFLIINEDQPSVYTLNKEDRQDSCRSWKTLKVMEFLFLISSPGKSWNLIGGHGKAICFPSSQGKETKGNFLSRWYHEKLRNFSAKTLKKVLLNEKNGFKKDLPAIPPRKFFHVYIMYR